eukprot:2288915-Rhodomonas_salina.1
MHRPLLLLQLHPQPPHLLLTLSLPPSRPLPSILPPPLPWPHLSACPFSRLHPVRPQVLEPCDACGDRTERRRPTPGPFSAQISRHKGWRSCGRMARGLGAERGRGLRKPVARLCGKRRCRARGRIVERVEDNAEVADRDGVAAVVREGARGEGGRGGRDVGGAHDFGFARVWRREVRLRACPDALRVGERGREALRVQVRWLCWDEGAGKGRWEARCAPYAMSATSTEPSHVLSRGGLYLASAPSAR